MQEIIFVGRNYTITKSVKTYIHEKISKHAELLSRSTNITVIVTSNNNDHGTRRNFKLEIAVDMPNAFIKVEDRGSDLTPIIDKLEVTLKRRLNRYNDQFKKWTRKEPWKIQDIDKDFFKVGEDSHSLEYNDYQPKIKRKEYDNDAPMNPAEAIERMEMLGHKSFLFKNVESGKYAMIYKRSELGYGMIQPKD